MSRAADKEPVEGVEDLGWKTACSISELEKD